MVARLTRSESDAFIGLLHAMGAGDGAAAARAVLRFSEAQTCVEDGAVAAFTADMADLFVERCRGFGTGVEFGSVLRGVLGLVRTHRVALDANYMTLVMNVLCLEGMAAALLPDYNVLDAARPLLSAHRRLPRPLFITALPTLRRIKGVRDRWWLRQVRWLARRRAKSAPPEGEVRCECREAGCRWRGEGCTVGRLTAVATIEEAGKGRRSRGVSQYDQEAWQRGAWRSQTVADEFRSTVRIDLS